MDAPKPPRESEVQTRRASIRKPLSLHIRYHQTGSVDVREGTLLDLTLSGAGLHTDGPLPVGKGIMLELVAPHGETARCAAEVEYSRRLSEGGYRTGLRFVEIGSLDRDALDEILRVNMPEEGDLYPTGSTPPTERGPRLPRGLERRRAGRLATERSIAYKVFGPSGRVELEGRAEIVDLSLTGISLRTTGPFRQGVSMQLEVMHISGLRSAIEAECIYSRKEAESNFIHGFRFTATEKSDLVHFSRLLAT